MKCLTIGSNDGLRRPRHQSYPGTDLRHGAPIVDGVGRRARFRLSLDHVGEQWCFAELRPRPETSRIADAALKEDDEIAALNGLVDVSDVRERRHVDFTPGHRELDMRLTG